MTAVSSGAVAQSEMAGATLPNPEVDPSVRAELVHGDKSLSRITDTIAGITEAKTPRWWRPRRFPAGTKVATRRTTIRNMRREGNNRE